MSPIIDNKKGSYLLSKPFKGSNRTLDNIGGGGGGLGDLPPLPESPVVIRSESTYDLVWGAGQTLIPSTVMHLAIGLYFDHYSTLNGHLVLDLSNQPLYSGLNVSVIQGIPTSNKSVAGGYPRLGLNIWASTVASWLDTHYTYTVKLKILQEIPTNLSNFPTFIAGWDYPVQVDRQGADNPMSFAGLYQLWQMSQDGTGGGLTVYKMVLTKLNTGYVYTATKSYDNTTFQRRNIDASDATWLALGINW